MEVVIIGAGPSGLVSAAVLQQFGHSVTVFEKAPDIGGVWSSTRRYPGLTTQDTRVTYTFSDLPMGTDVPEHPTGADVHDYLHRYADRHRLHRTIRLGTCVESAVPLPDGSGWRVDVVGPDGPGTHRADWLVVANGVFSTPQVPEWPGRREFEMAGGQVVVPSALGAGGALVDRHVTVVGWGKTACDIAAAAAEVGRSTTVVARRVMWKVPKQVAGRLGFRHLLLTRLGEHVMGSARTDPWARIARLADLPLRRAALWWLRGTIARRSGLSKVGLVPTTPLPYSDSLVTDGFFEAVAEGRIDVRRERSVHRLGAADGRPGVELSDGTWVVADVLVAATGFDQVLPFLDPEVQEALRGPDGVVVLHRRTLPAGVPRLAFIGWGHTYRSLLTAEVGAVWLAAHLAGLVGAPTPDDLRSSPDRYHLTHHAARAHGESQLPNGSFWALDALLADLDLDLPVAVRLRQWFTPLDPATYRYLVPALQRRLGRAPTPTEDVVPRRVDPDRAGADAPRDDPTSRRQHT